MTRRLWEQYVITKSNAAFAALGVIALGSANLSFSQQPDPLTDFQKGEIVGTFAKAP